MGSHDPVPAPGQQASSQSIILSQKSFPLAPAHLHLEDTWPHPTTSESGSRTRRQDLPAAKKERTHIHTPTRTTTLRGSRTPESLPACTVPANLLPQPTSSSPPVQYT